MVKMELLQRLRYFTLVLLKNLFFEFLKFNISRYLLEVVRIPDTVDPILDILIRMIRHSAEVASEISSVRTRFSLAHTTLTSVFPQ